ncbi:MAG: hypothetical protein WA081_13995 [Desulfosalsimonadaceae bacterium]
MEALRLMAKPVNRRIIIDLPPGMDADTVEIIVLANRKIHPEKMKRRTPPSQLAKTEIYDDLIAPAIPETDWDALR